MNWFETFFHISPDGGSGATELLYGIAIAAALAAALFRRHIVGAFRSFR